MSPDWRAEMLDLVDAVEHLPEHPRWAVLGGLRAVVKDALATAARELVARQGRPPRPTRRGNVIAFPAPRPGA